MYRAPRGAKDILPDEQPWWEHVDRTAADLLTLYGFRRIDTPIFEEADLFVRSVGEATDVAEKETYTFEDRGGDLLSLRPEGTAGVARAYVEHGMHVLPQPVRLYSTRLPMFRYDRPQAGRQRQFHQLNVEMLGSADPEADVEIIEIAWRFFANLGLRGLTLFVNSMGDAASRPRYIEALRDYYGPLLPRLGADAQRRFEANPLRLLDGKDEVSVGLAAEAPRSTDFLEGDAADHWGAVLDGLEALRIPYSIDHTLVRGLDYYTHTVFEIAPPEEGQQSTLGGGGRYDGLIEQIGGKPTPAVGFASGIERIILNLKRQGVEAPGAPPVTALVAFLGDDARRAALALTSSLRAAAVSAVMAPGGKSLKAQLRYAGSIGAEHALILGGDEVRDGTVTVKRLADGEQHTLPTAEAVARLGE